MRAVNHKQTLFHGKSNLCDNSCDLFFCDIGITIVHYIGDEPLNFSGP